MKQSSEFMLLFRFNPSSTYQPTAAEMAESQNQWAAIQSKALFNL